VPVGTSLRSTVCFRAETKYITVAVWGLNVHTVITFQVVSALHSLFIYFLD